MPYKPISRQPVEGKTIAMRIDLNSSIENGKPVVSARFFAHGKTVKALCNKGAKLVLLAHQGQKGKKTFASLENHAPAFARASETEIVFCSWKEDYKKIIENTGFGKAVLLENTRFQEGEDSEKNPKEHSKAEWIRKIASVSDFFVEDALSVCHRPHGSVVGFSSLLPCFSGPALEKELSALEKLNETRQKRLFVLGGAKIEDSIDLIGELLGRKKAEAVCATGLLGELFLKANGIALGAKDAFFKEQGFDALVPKARELLKNYSKQIFLPLDVAIDNNGVREEIPIEKLPSKMQIKDIGEKTISALIKKVSSSEFVVLNGPAGVFEEEGFETGTKEIFGALSESKKPCILGGGDTETAIGELGFSEEDFFHVSLAGKALLEYLSGKKLPGLEILK